MRDPKRIDGIINRLRAAWKTQPSLRLGQLILNGFDDDMDLYYAEDEPLIAEIERITYDQ